MLKYLWANQTSGVIRSSVVISTPTPSPRFLSWTPAQVQPCEELSVSESHVGTEMFQHLLGLGPYFGPYLVHYAICSSTNRIFPPSFWKLGYIMSAPSRRHRSLFSFNANKASHKACFPHKKINIQTLVHFRCLLCWFGFVSLWWDSHLCNISLF